MRDAVLGMEKLSDAARLAEWMTPKGKNEPTRHRTLALGMFFADGSLTGSVPEQAIRVIVSEVVEQAGRRVACDTGQRVAAGGPCASACPIEPPAPALSPR